MEQRECPVCRRTFEGRNNQRFCPPPKDWAGKGQPRSKCAKAYDNAKRRGTLDELLARGTVGASFDCDECGKRCTPGEDGVAPHARRFCCRDCKWLWFKTDERSTEVAARKAKRRWNEAKRRLAAAQRGNPSRQWITGQCHDCDKVFTACRAASWSAHYCSSTCQARAAKTRRRAVKQGAWVEDVRRTVVFERDGWTCQLCGDPVEPDIRYPDDQCASLDHIIPLALGGKHSYANTQLAHTLCNSLKGDRESGSMMFAT